MALSPIKVLMFLFVMQFAIGAALSAQFTETQQTNSINDIMNMEEKQTQIEQDFTDEDKLYNLQSNQQLEENTVGNSITTSKGIWDMFANGLNPVSITPDMYDEQIEKTLASAIVFFRVTLLSSGLIMILYMVIKNKYSG